MSEKWIEALQQNVAACWEWHSPALQITFRYVEPDQEDDFWEIWAYPAVQEIVGGKEDGETVCSGFNFDVLAFLTEFEAEAVALSTRQLAHPGEPFLQIGSRNWKSPGGRHCFRASRRLPPRPCPR
jgi:hypothetical protein